jgi:hypothetical protein
MAVAIDNPVEKGNLRSRRQHNLRPCIHVNGYTHDDLLFGSVAMDHDRRGTR